MEALQTLAVGGDVRAVVLVEGERPASARDARRASRPRPGRKGTRHRPDRRRAVRRSLPAAPRPRRARPHAGGPATPGRNASSGAASSERASARPHACSDGVARLLRVRARPGGRARSSLGGAAVESILEAQGELRSFRTYQKQQAHRDRAHEEQLQGFMTNRQIRYARLLVEALDLARVPQPARPGPRHVTRR